MEIKKSWLSNLENFRGLFFLVGIALSLLLTTEVLQIEKRKQIPEIKGDIPHKTESGVLVPRIERTRPEKPEPKTKETEPDPLLDPEKKFKIVDNTTKLNTNNIEPISLDSIDYEPSPGFDDPEPVNPFNVEYMARPKACESLRDKEAQMSCFNEWITNYLAEEVEFPQIPDYMARSETIYVEFVIDREGKVGEVVILRGEVTEYREEAKRVIEKMPALVPARQFNRTVPVRVRIPVNFKIR